MWAASPRPRAKRMERRSHPSLCTQSDRREAPTWRLRNRAQLVEKLAVGNLEKDANIAILVR